MHDARCTMHDARTFDAEEPINNVASTPQDLVIGC